jgi:hypothetical protein
VGAENARQAATRDLAPAHGAPSAPHTGRSNHGSFYRAVRFQNQLTSRITANPMFDAGGWSDLFEAS